MKRIIAFMKPNMLDDVIFALHKIESFPGASISEVREIGSGSRSPAKHDDRAPFDLFQKSVRMEIVCAAALTEEVVKTIQRNAHTGLPDDGAISVSPVDQAVLICTGECNGAAG